MKLYIARHGQTDWNLQHKVQGQTDVPLNETGIEQAKELRDEVSKVSFDACFASPLSRAYKTAEIATEGKYKITLDDRLRERCFGEIEGRIGDTWLQITGGIDIFDRKLNFGGMSIEPVNAMLARAKSFLDDVQVQYPDDAKILVVAHAGILRNLHFTIVGYDENTDFSTFNIKNGELMQYDL